MSFRSTLVLGSILVVGMLGCQRSEPIAPAGPGQQPAEPAVVADSPGDRPLAAAEVVQGGEGLEVSGPFTHKNLTVFLIHRKNQDKRDFLTLDEGLKSGAVRVTEKAQEQVSELQIDNESDQPLYLQEGDRLQGGKQDRIIIASLIVPAKSGKMPVPTNCIEQGRWQPGQMGYAFGNTANAALATKEVRLAAKVMQDQGAVWESVAGAKMAAMATLSAPNTTSSLNETLDSAEVKRISEEFATALAGALKAKEEAVGVALLVNNQIEEVNVYPNRRLLGKLYPRLLQSYALMAAIQKDQSKNTKPVSGKDVLAFLSQPRQERAKRTDAINKDNQLSIAELDESYRCTTCYDGQVVHQQVLRKSDPNQALNARSFFGRPMQLNSAPTPSPRPER
jgi:hypothetical protein